jgi:hypothetical protein
MTSNTNTRHCTCWRYCRGGQNVSRATWFRHTKYREDLPSYIPEQSENHPGGVPGGTEGMALEENATGASAKRQRLDEPTSPAQSPRYSNPAVPGEYGGRGYNEEPAFELYLEPREEPDMQTGERTPPDYRYHEDSGGT